MLEFRFVGSRIVLSVLIDIHQLVDGKGGVRSRVKIAGNQVKTAACTPVPAEIVKRLTNHGVGFAAPRNDSVTLSDDNVLSQVEPQDLYRFGLIPELVGRIPVITHTKALTADAMVRILTEPRNALVRQYQELFAFDGIELVFEDEALRTIGETALERQAGARGLRSICESILRDSMFELPGTTEVHRVIVAPDLTVRYE